jgi:hypothetical protein
MNRRRYIPSPTLLLHVAVVLCGVGAAVGSTTTTVKLVPARPAAPAAADIQLQSAATFRFGIQYGRELPAGSRWREVGLLPHGTVYRPLNSVFMLDARQAGEAYPVVASGKLQGFYLPKESSFAPVRPVALTLDKPRPETRTQVASAAP